MRQTIIVAAFAMLALYISYPVFAQDTVLNMGYQPSTHQIAEMVAFEKGWWQEELKPFGITEVKEFQFPTGAPEMQAMLAGDLDVAYVGTAPPITAISQGLDARIVAAVNINGSNLVFSPDIEYIGPKSLIGLDIATFPPGTIQDIVLKKWLTDNNVDIAKVNIKGMSPGDAVTAISAGKVDGVFLPHPSPAIIEDEGKGRSVVASGEMWPNHACCSLVVSGKLIRENPELVKQIIRIHNNATEYINEHPEEAAEIYAKRTGQDIDQVKKSLQTWDGKWISDPHEEIPSTLEYAAVDYELKYIDKEVSEEDLFDTSFYDSLD
ncbi:MAG: ABC transporter substrate-binding protein [Methanothrix sp.]|nr:ABC transporter substrate-binding protein [Methanothrix sp.]